MKGRVTSELRKIFRPELLKRIDEIIVFHKLEREDMRPMIEIQIKRLRQQLGERDVPREFPTEALEARSAAYDRSPDERDDPARRGPQRLQGDHRDQRQVLRGDKRGGVY